jgi:hypothetical protein
MKGVTLSQLRDELALDTFQMASWRKESGS